MTAKYPVLEQMRKGVVPAVDLLIREGELRQKKIKHDPGSGNLGLALSFSKAGRNNKGAPDKKPKVLHTTEVRAEKLCCRRRPLFRGFAWRLLQYLRQHGASRDFAKFLSFSTLPFFG